MKRNLFTIILLVILTAIVSGSSSHVASDDGSGRGLALKKCNEANDMYLRNPSLPSDSISVMLSLLDELFACRS